MIVPVTRYDDENKKIDYDALRWLLAHMHQNHMLFKLIKAEMEKRGNWKPAPKGKGFQKGNDQRRHILPTSSVHKNSIDQQGREKHNY